MTAKPGRPPSVEHVAVVVPANNEADTVVDTLDSIDDARRRLPDDVTSAVIVVLDTCTDETLARVVERRHRSVLSLPAPTIVQVEARSAGAARSAGFARALHAAPIRPERMWIATTDADTIVPPDWLRVQLASAEDGVDAIAGIVDLGRDAPRHLRRRFASCYAVDADGTHRHVHGANMGMRASSYLASGGWAPIQTGEDQELWHRLGKVCRCVSSTRVSVCTSSRLVGRAPAGFAADLRALIDAEIVA